ncbi:heme oxygenase-like protein [Tothia fuscella]|uniref:Heme oxygenase-like protein n=1 Tax=Tothia fuscella TaxID=1048955 RepID=A0A9P4NUZ7_9PEZI|nr:heme oxygenase-like protein [Tothia fuscella]
MADTTPLTLSAEINAATRPHHISLNRYITSRLPLCLPPRTATPEIYVAGLEHFASIFFTFESIWDKITASADVSRKLEDTWESLDSLSSSGSSAGEDPVTTFLRTLRPLGISRSERLHLDLARLNREAGSETVEQMRGEAQTEFMAHIRETVRQKPHVLIAYAWCMYMAVFSGGRWIRSQLCASGEEFWTGNAAREAPNTDGRDDLNLGKFEGLGLSFWFFPGAQDGEDIKADFKQRLQEGEAVLTAEQRADVVAEAQEIFNRCDSLVRELDSMRAKVDSLPGSSLAVGGKQKLKEDYWLGMPGYAGLALVFSCVSWYAMYHAGTWN